MNAIHAVRFREEFELRCEACSEWWPLTLEFWRPIHGIARCRACLRDKDAEAQRLRRKPKAAARRKTKTWQSALRKRLLQRAAQARYYRSHSDDVRAKRRDIYYALKLAEVTA